MSFAFVSHASPDKKERVRPLVKALVHEGFKVWVDVPDISDDPPGLDLPRDYIRRNGILHLRSGFDYRHEIEEAVREAGVVLGCLGARVSDDPRDIFREELGWAISHQKLVLCVIDETPFAQLPVEGLSAFADRSGRRVDPAAIGRAVEMFERGSRQDDLPPDIRRQWEIFLGVADQLRQQIEQAEAGAAPEPRRLPEPPREQAQIDQEAWGDIGRNDVIGAFRGIFQRRDPVVPVFLSGPDKEMINAFIARVCKRVAQEETGMALHRVSFSWPNGRPFRDAYLNALHAALRARDVEGATVEDRVVNALAAPGRPVLVDTVVARPAWNDDRFRAVGEWLELWHDLAGQLRERVFPVIYTLFGDPVSPSWHWRMPTEPPCPDCGQRWPPKTNLEILRAMDEYGEADGPGPERRSFFGLFRRSAEPARPRLPLTRLDVVTPVLRSDLGPWLGSEHARLEVELAAIFDKDERRDDGVPMQHWLVEAPRTLAASGTGA